MTRSVLLCFWFGVMLSGASWAKPNDPCRPPFCKEPQPQPLLTPVPPLFMLGRCDRCNDIPVDRYSMLCPAGQHVVCQTGPSYPPLIKCPIVTYGVCADVPTEGTIIPKFQIMYVAYSPPGRGSSVTYAKGTTLGTSTSVAQTWQNSTDLGVGVGVDVLVASGSLNVNTNATVTGKGTKQEDVQFQQSESMKVPGQGDFVDHNYDQIWFWVKPAIRVKVQERPGPPYPVATEVSWQYEDGQQVTTFWVYAGELLGNIEMPGEVRAQMEAWGITREYYGELLSADPLVWATNVVTTDYNGRPIELMLEAGYMHPARFELVQVVPYRPLGSPTEQPTVITYSVQQSRTSSVQTELSQSYSVGVDYGAKLSFIAQARWKMGNKFTYTVHTTTKLSNGGSTTDTLAVGQPSFGYKGPVVLYVYMDKLWHTYAFKLE